jgi:hypothetical protein
VNRRHFLVLSGGAALGAAVMGRQADASRSSTIPVGADALCEKRHIPPLADYQRLTFSNDRDAALYAMQAVHRAIPYGETPGASTVDEFLKLDRAECGTYTRVQDQVCQFYGLTTRRLRFANSFHG